MHIPKAPPDPPSPTSTARREAIISIYRQTDASKNKKSMLTGDNWHFEAGHHSEISGDRLALAGHLALEGGPGAYRVHESDL